MNKERIDCNAEFISWERNSCVDIREDKSDKSNHRTRFWRGSQFVFLLNGFEREGPEDGTWKMVHRSEERKQRNIVWTLGLEAHGSVMGHGEIIV